MADGRLLFLALMMVLFSVSLSIPAIPMRHSCDQVILSSNTLLHKL